MRKAARWIALALVAATAVFGVPNAVDELGDGDTLLQKSVGVAVTLYAVSSWLVLLGVWRRRRWAAAFAVVWTMATMWAAAMGSYAWGNAPWGAVLGAGGSCLLLGAWVVWAVRDAVGASSAAPVAAPQPRT